MWIESHQISRAAERRAAGHFATSKSWTIKANVLQQKYAIKSEIFKRRGMR